LSDVVPELFYAAWLKVSVSVEVSNPVMCGDRPPSHSAHLAPSAQAGLSGVWTGPIGSPPTCSLTPSVITD